MPNTPAAAISYRVQTRDPHTHLLDVTLTIAEPQVQQRVSLPVWIPGSYLVREFSKQLQHLTAQQGRTRLAATQLDKCTWQIDCKPGKALVLDDTEARWRELYRLEGPPAPGAPARSNTENQPCATAARLAVLRNKTCSFCAAQ